MENHVQTSLWDELIEFEDQPTSEEQLKETYIPFLVNYAFSKLEEEMKTWKRKDWVELFQAFDDRITQKRFEIKKYRNKRIKP